MSQTIALLDTLKRTLRMRGITYRQLAEKLDMSEASIKRLFSSKHVSLERLEKICQLAQTSLTELVKQMENDMRTVDQLSEEQEKEITNDTGLLLVTFLVVNGWSYQEISGFCTFSEPQLVRYLALLDRLKMIELLPNNRFSLLISPHFAWRKDGPIQRFFNQHLRGDFLNSSFNRQHESLLFLTAMLTPSSCAVLQKRLDDLAREFNELNHRDKQQPLDDRYLTSVILAVRPWKAGVFSQYIR